MQDKPPPASLFYKPVASAEAKQSSPHLNNSLSNQFQLGAPRITLYNFVNYSPQVMRSKRSSINDKCKECRVSITTQWREGPDGPMTLCNACGLRWKKDCDSKSKNSGTEMRANERKVKKAKKEKKSSDFFAPDIEVETTDSKKHQQNKQDEHNEYCKSDQSTNKLSISYILNY